MKDNPPAELVQPNYAEFDDVKGPYNSSEKARQAIIALKSKHGLGFVFNPGGGQFTCIDSSYPLNGFDCQISTYDDVRDLSILRVAIDLALKRKAG